MYSESDIEAAVASGVLTPEAAAALRESVASSRQTSLVDEESFRLITGFNDIFVSIAAILLLVAVGWIGGSIGQAIFGPFGSSVTGAGYYNPSAVTHQLAATSFTGGALVAATSWLLAEYFTRKRRMALPSILLLGTFALATMGMLIGLFQLISPSFGVRTMSILVALSALLTAGAIYLHWRRFQVPITIAALTGALVATLVNIVLAIVPGSQTLWLWMMLLAGLCVFAFAMWWDMSDPARTTRRSDVAFWLHLAAAPMIAHPIFWLLGVVSGSIGAATALLVIALYLVFGIVALAIDRRALLVSSLVYVLYALAGLFRQFGAVSLSVALTALVIGSALLMLSAFWQPMRRLVVKQLPAGLAERLPLLDRRVVAAR
jgi:hypothetical protein